MGIIPKKKPELEVLDESRAHRNSYHLRGQSHSSALRNVTRAGEHSPSDETNRHSGQKGTFLRRLSSVPEQKQYSKKADDLVDSAKCLLFSLYSLQPHLDTAVALAKNNKSRRASLERYKHQGSVQLEHLDQSLHDLEDAVGKNKSKNIQKHARKTVCRALHASITLFIQIGGILTQNIAEFVAHGDKRRLRGLIVALWGSLNEQRNARRKLIHASSPQDTLGNLRSESQASTRVLRDDALTPTQDHPRLGRRSRNGSVSQKLQNQPNIAAIVNSRPNTSHSTVPSTVNSRSSSRTGMYYPSSASSFTNTPRSGDSFGANLFPPRSRAGSVSANPERARRTQEEQDQFERIYKTLSKAVEKGMSAIHQLESRFIRSLDEAHKPWVKSEVRQLWDNIVQRTHACGESTEALKRRLDTLRVNDPTMRNSSNLWRLVKNFSESYIRLVSILKANRGLVTDASTILRPSYKLITEAVALIGESPWEKLQNDSLPPSQVNSRAPTPVQSYPLTAIHTQNMPPSMVPPPSMATHQQYQHRRPNGSNGSAPGSTSSPFGANIPATPMSAALGPAAQATVPKTPASSSGSMAGMFEGNVFQRADTLLQHGQTSFRRPSGAP